ncbi:MAG: hypothetical protein KKH98_14075 [Spirochaetes bacterium]|nr:hypothetical protein [Spirochaetota bacterium]
MGKKKTLLEKVKENPNNVKFNELTNLAEIAGYIFRNANGGHKIYVHPNLETTAGKIMNFQPDKNNHKLAKAYQVRQLINSIDENDLIKEKNEN